MARRSAARDRDPSRGRAVPPDGWGEPSVTRGEEDLPLDNPLVRDELARTGEELHRLEVQASWVEGALLGFFTSAILFGGMVWWAGAGFGAITIVGTWGVQVAAKNRAIRRSRARLNGIPASPDPSLKS